MKSKNSSTIGLLTYGIEDTIGRALWTGVADLVRERGANLVCFPGGMLRSRAGFDVQRNLLYDLASAESVDGLVIWSALLHHVDVEEAMAFYERYHPLPVVSVALPLEGIPSVLADNYQGTRDEIVHLIEAHGYRRIAFIRGPEGHSEAEERYRAYIDVLDEYGIDLDPSLIAPGDNQLPSGVAAMCLLLDERKLQPQADLEAVVAANDNMALGALEALQARGMRVPGDVAIVGFDDTEQAASAMPPLTTVQYSFYEQGRQAAELLLAQIEGQEAPELGTLPMKLVVRQSCGCLTPAVVEAAVQPVVGADGAFDAALAAQRKDILSEMMRAVEVSSVRLVPGWAEQLLDALVVELKRTEREDTPGIFLSVLNDTLYQVAAMDGDVGVWQRALSALRRYTLPCLGDDMILARAENIWQQARVLIGETAQRVQVYRELQAEQQAQTLRGIGQALITTFDMEELTDVLARELPRLGIPSCYLSLYEGQEVLPNRSRLILAYDEKGRVGLESGGRRFLTRQLIPDGMLHREKPYHVLVEALYFRENQIGFVLFEAEPRDGTIYEALRGQISSALKGALLLEERKRVEEALERAYAEVEKRVEERTAELRRETAERERLQQKVIEAQSQALQELSTPIIPVMDRIIVMPLIGSIDSMRARDITRALLAGIREHRAQVVILDITGVPVVDSGVANHLNKTIQAARLKGARTIVTGISDAVAETIVDLGIDWSGIETLFDLQTGLIVALNSLGVKLRVANGRGGQVIGR